MAIVIKLDDMLHARRMTLTELSARVGITLANLSIRKPGKARAVRFSTLAALCRERECRPGDLLAFDPGPAEPDDGGEDEVAEAPPAQKRRGRPPLLKARAEQG